MSCQPLLLYSLIVERSVSHPVRLTAGVPLVTPRCPLPADAIVAAAAAGRGEPGPAGCETILGRKRRESRSCLLREPAQPSVSESTPLPLLPHPPPGDRLCHPLTFVCVCVSGMRVKIAFFFFAPLLLSSGFSFKFPF